METQVSEVTEQTEGLDFGQAIRAMKAGRFVARKGWNGKGMFLYLVEGQSLPVDALRGNAKKALEFSDSIEYPSHEMYRGNAAFVRSSILCELHRRIGAHIDMKAADGSIVVGWLASQTDMLATDWCIIF